MSVFAVVALAFAVWRRTWRPLVFAGLLVSYALATTVGFPLLHPEAEPVDGLALATKAFEIVGLLTALNLLRRRPAASLTFINPKGTLA